MQKFITMAFMKGLAYIINWFGHLAKYTSPYDMLGATPPLWLPVHPFGGRGYHRYACRVGYIPEH